MKIMFLNQRQYENKIEANFIFFNVKILELLYILNINNQWTEKPGK